MKNSKKLPLVIFKFNSIQALAEAISTSITNNSFELNLENVKNSTLKEIGEEINSYLKDIYNKYIWKQGVVGQPPRPYGRGLKELCP